MSNLSLAGFTFAGESVAGIGTAIAVRELRLCFDLGHLCPAVLSSPNIFLSHAHTDHCGEVMNYLATRALENRDLATLFVPPSMAAPLAALLSDWQKMSASKFDYRIVMACPGAPLPLRSSITVTPFELSHLPETQGYLVEESVRKLRPEFRHLSAEEIVQKKGLPDFDRMFEIRCRPLVTFVPDTLPEGLDSLPEAAWRSRVLFVESSFLDDRKPIEAVRKGRHLVLDDIAARLDRFEGEHLVLFHFSRIYAPDEIEALVASRLPEHHRNKVVCFITR
jgi:ribonuclease Z